MAANTAPRSVYLDACGPAPLKPLTLYCRNYESKQGPTARSVHALSPALPANTIAAIDAFKVLKSGAICALLCVPSGYLHFLAIP